MSLTGEEATEQEPLLSPVGDLPEGRSLDSDLHNPIDGAAVHADDGNIGTYRSQE